MQEEVLVEGREDVQWGFRALLGHYAPCLWGYAFYDSWMNWGTDNGTI